MTPSYKYCVLPEKKINVYILTNGRDLYLSPPLLCGNSKFCFIHCFLKFSLRCNPFLLQFAILSREILVFCMTLPSNFWPYRRSSSLMQITFLFWSQARVLTYYRLNYCLKFGIQIIDVENTIQFIFRAAELKSLKGRKYLDAWCVYFWATTPAIISILTFTTYALLGNKLTAAKVQIVFLIMFKHVQWNPVNTDIDRAHHSVLIKQVSILSGLIVEKISEPFFVGPY